VQEKDRAAFFALLLPDLTLLFEQALPEPFVRFAVRQTTQQHNAAEVQG
jgi:hypothetical protein